MLRFKSIEIIKTINKFNNLTKASEELYIAQSNLSRSLKSIENELGYQVFDRENNFILTKEGEILLKYIVKFEKLNKELNDEIFSIQNKEKEKITISALSFLSSYLFPQILPKFANLYPNLSISLSELTSKNYESALINQETDICFSNLSPKSKKISGHFICNDTVYIVYNSSLNDILSIHDLKNVDFYLLKEWQNMRQISEDIFSALDFNPSKIHEVPSIMSAITMVRSKKAATFVCKSALLSLNISGDLKYFEVSGSYASINIFSTKSYFDKYIFSLSDLILNEFINKEL